MTRPRTRSVARMEAAAAAAEGEARNARNPDGAQGSRQPNEGEGSRRRPDAAAEGSGEPVPDAEAAAQLAVVPFDEDINQYLRALEADPTRRPMINYDQVIQQGHITMRMREMLLDWLVDVAYDREISDEGLHLAVSYVDRFLSMNSINRNRLQLLGVTALFVASKYEERSYLSARKLSDMTNRTYTAKEVVVMEANILRDLDHKLGGPTAITFVRTFLSKCRGKKPRDKRLELMCSYLAELSLLDAYYIRFLPSMVAAACLFVAKFTINPKTRPWNLSVQRSTGYRVSDIEDCIRAIHDLQRRKNRNFLPEDGNVSNLTAVRDKYERDEERFERVATIAPPKTIRASFLKDREYVNG